MPLIPTLYLTRNGLLEPLGQSQVFAYLRGLSADHAITLISYEKDEDWADEDRMARGRAQCAEYGIRWLPQRFRPKPRFVAPALDMVQMVRMLLREQWEGRARLIHARSYIPAAAALLVHRLTGAPFIFDMRALWPEELITAGRLRRGSLLHRAIVAVERRCLREASAVISLTHAAVDHLKREYPEELADQKIVVIPTCADLDRFTLAAEQSSGPTIHGCIGTILSGWFRTDWLAAWISTVAAEDPDAKFDILTRDDAGRIRAELDPEGNLGARLRIGARSPKEMPAAVHSHDLSVMFFTDGLSKLGSAPTRLAEVLGCGLPVVVNEGVGDVAKIVRENRVGVILDGSGSDQIKAALRDLNELMQDPDLKKRCRATAETVFSLETGTGAYRELYSSILSAGDRTCAG
ncbi:glycosyltransferase [Qipengyuania gaetbuli]|uniref:glycosyltransferase n=1 Tax=Qipengyuania gaetbuli TaxID=266952 RepID=UPI001C99FBBE|nr:glycosyltransferase [Qipengyuania gaetbuli]MBY6016080.1 glycosyltransferase [Qipengyuania gaetbuli]